MFFKSVVTGVKFWVGQSLIRSSVL